MLRHLVLPPIDRRRRQESVFSYGQHDPGFESRQGKITHLRNVHSGPGADPASRKMGTEGEVLSPLLLKRTGRQTDHRHIIDTDIQGVTGGKDHTSGGCSLC